MADGGWIKMWRSVLDWEHYDNINMRLLWFHILLKAEYDGENIGTLQTSLSELSTACQMSKPQVRRCLTVLAESGQIEHWRSGNALMVKINNWKQYQGKKHTFEHTCEHTYEHTSNKAQTVGVKPKTEGAKEEKKHTCEHTFEHTCEHTDIPFKYKEGEKLEDEIHFLARNSAEVLERDALLYPDGWIE